MRRIATNILQRLYLARNDQYDAIKNIKDTNQFLFQPVCVPKIHRYANQLPGCPTKKKTTTTKKLNKSSALVKAKKGTKRYGKNEKKN